MQKVEFKGFGGVAIAGDTFGSPGDPAVLLVPSAGQVREFWHGSAQALAAAGRFAICIDLRGHGDSGHARDARYDLEAYSGDLKAVLASLPTRAYVVAAGLGALAAITAVGECAPDLVSGLALVDASIWFDEKATEKLRDSMIKRASDFADVSNIVDAISAGLPGEPRAAASSRLLAAFSKRPDGRLQWRGDPEAFAQTNFFLERDRLSAAVSKIFTPVLLIRGALNETVSGDVVRRLQSMIPGSELTEIEGAGHYVASEHEEAFNAVLLDFLERKIPRQPLKYIGGSEPRVLREALGCFGTGVTVVTTVDAQGTPLGLTANSFTSVSLDPPLILFSLAKTSGSLATFVKAGRFAVNVLHIGQQPVANRFARRDVARFDELDWAILSEEGSPIITGSLASFDCGTYAVHDGGDHMIFIGRVDHAWYEPRRDPLLYFRGKYRRLHFA